MLGLDTAKFILYGKIKKIFHNLIFVATKYLARVIKHMKVQSKLKVRGIHLLQNGPISHAYLGFTEKCYKINNCLMGV